MSRLSYIVHLLWISILLAAAQPAKGQESEWYDHQGQKARPENISAALLKSSDRSNVQHIQSIQAKLKTTGVCSLTEREYISYGLIRVNDDYLDDVKTLLAASADCPNMSRRMRIYRDITGKFLQALDAGKVVSLLGQVDEKDDEAYFLAALYDIILRIEFQQLPQAISALNILNMRQGHAEIYPFYQLMKYWAEAYLYVELVDMEKAVSFYEKAYLLAQKHQELTVDVATTMYNLAFTYGYDQTEKTDDYETAQTLYKELMNFYNRSGVVGEQFYVHYGLIALYYNVRDYKTCYQYSAENQVSLSTASPLFSASYHQIMSLCAVHIGKIDEAVRYMDMANQTIEANKITLSEEARQIGQLIKARIDFAKGNVEQAYKELDAYQQKIVEILRSRNSKQMIQDQSRYAAIIERQKAAAELAETRSKLEQTVIAGIVIIMGLLFGSIYSLSRKNKQLRKREAEAVEASNNKSFFLANISHEVRTPLNAIIGFSEMLQSELFGQQSDKSKEYISHIKNSGTHLLLIINELLDLSKLTSGQYDLTIDKVKVNVADVAEQAIRLTEIDAEKKAITMVCRQQADKPITADQRLLVQALVNIISNAIKFSPEQSEIHLTITQGERRTKFELKDFGAGMTKEQSMRVLLPFEQAQNVYSRSHEGAGLGLAIVSEIVTLHKGELILDSVLGEGTTVTLCVPNVHQS